MRKMVLAGISISLLAMIIFTACGNTQIDIKGGSSVSVSSVHINLENSSDDTASVLSESASSVITSSNKAFNSNKVTSSQMSTSSKEVYSKNENSSSSNVEKAYSEYTKEEIEKLNMEDNKVAVQIKKDYVKKKFTVADFPEVDGTNIYIYDVMLDVNGALDIYITLKEHNKQEVFEAMKKLEKNQYVEKAYPLIIYTTN
jgi:hypothetical protein